MPKKPSASSRAIKPEGTGIPSRKPAAAGEIRPEGSALDAFDLGRYHEEIARGAYALWEERGCTGGAREEDWLRAEARVRSRHDAAGS